jgi:hypothetical protein
MAPRKPSMASIALALAAMARSLRMELDPILSLDDQARAEGVTPGSDAYDDAAELIGRPYCRALDLYVDRPTRDRAERLHFTEAHLALV